MELRQLRYFVAVGEAEHFGRGAERVRVAQPAVSRQIRDLEQELGIVLFERLPRGVRLSEAGRVFLEDARRILADVDRACGRVRDVGRGVTGTLRLAIVESASWHGPAPEALRRFRESRPKVEVELAPMPSFEGHEAVGSGRVDAAFAYFCPQDPGLGRMAIAVNDVVAVVPKDHPLATREISIADLRNEPLIAFRRASAPPYYDLVMDALARGGITPKIVQLAVNEPAMLSFISAGLGIAIMTSTLRWRRPEDVVLKPVKGLSIPITLELIWRKDSGSTVLEAFVAVVRNALGSPDDSRADCDHDSPHPAPEAS